MMTVYFRFLSVNDVSVNTSSSDSSASSFTAGGHNLR